MDIEAFKATEDRQKSDVDWPEWLRESIRDGKIVRKDSELSIDGKVIPYGFYIIKGVQDEIYTHSPDMFDNIKHFMMYNSDAICHKSIRFSFP